MAAKRYRFHEEVKGLLNPSVCIFKSREINHYLYKFIYISLRNYYVGN